MPFCKQKIFFLVVALLVFQGNVHAQKAVSAQEAACSSSNGSVVLHWLKVQHIKGLKLPSKIGSTKLPLRYEVFKVNKGQLKKYMGTLKAGSGNIFLPVPVNPGCLQFNVSNSGTMSQQLAAKFPDIVSLKGIGNINKASTVRLDFDGIVLNAEINHEGDIYIIAPWKKGKTIYYLLYRKQDSGVERKPFSEK